MFTRELARQLLAGPDILVCIIGQGSEDGSTVPLKTVEAVACKRRIPLSEKTQARYMLKDDVANDDEEWREIQQEYGRPTTIVRLS